MTAMLVAAHTVSGQLIAVKTNVLMLAALTPNLSCEMVVGEHSSIDLSLLGHYNPYSTDSRLIAFQPEYRYWFNGRPMVREFIGLAALGAMYNMTWNQTVYDGNAIGAGITAGYSLILGKRLNLEFYGGFGAVYFQQNQYNINDNFEDSFTGSSRQANARGYKLLPIKIGITLSYIIK